MAAVRRKGKGLASALATGSYHLVTVVMSWVCQRLHNGYYKAVQVHPNKSFLKTDDSHGYLKGRAMIPLASLCLFRKGENRD